MYLVYGHLVGKFSIKDMIVSVHQTIMYNADTACKPKAKGANKLRSIKIQQNQLQIHVFPSFPDKIIEYHGAIGYGIFSKYMTTTEYKTAVTSLVTFSKTSSKFCPSYAVSVSELALTLLWTVSIKICQNHMIHTHKY